MNNVYFACTECKTLVEAGYRWAYWELERPGTVLRGRAVEVDRLLSVGPYWNPKLDEQSSWLTSVLANAKQFILSHKAHRIVYGDTEQVMGADIDEYDQFDWMNEYPDDWELQPRNFIEQFGMRTWGEVTSYLASRSTKPAWYERSSRRVVARRKFDELVLLELHHPQSHPKTEDAP